MDWWEKVVFPVKRAWLAVIAPRPKTTSTSKSGQGILDLHEDVQTCEYQDVQVMWEMLRPEMEELAAAGHHHHGRHRHAKHKRPLPGDHR